MRKILFASVALIALALLMNCGDSARVTPTTGLTNTVAFIREASGGGTVAMMPNQLHPWRFHNQGQTLARIHNGAGIAPWDADIDPGTDSVVTIKMDGTNEKVIANQAGTFYNVQIGDNGKSAAFSAESLGHSQVFTATLTDLSKITLKQLTTDAESHGWPQLSFDGSQVLFMKYADTGNGTEVQTVVMSTSGGTEKVIATPGVWTFAPSFLKDGRIIFTNDYTNQIEVMNADGTGMAVVTHPASTAWDAFPAVSADGKTVVFSRADSTTLTVDVFTQQMDGTGLKKLTTDGSSWDPMFVGGKIAFVSLRDNVTGAEIYSMNLDGTSQTRLTNNNVNDSFIYD